MILFVILIILISAILGLIVLVQNPKGGGLASSIGGINNQFMGVKQTTDVLEKGTWIFAALIALLCLFSPAFISNRSDNGGENILEKVNTRPSTSAPLPGSTAPATPGSATPATPGSATPATPGSATPANPGQATPRPAP
ncbi:MAG: preprotein translocase subunit SecG [Chitinophagaceae bacterium]|nr:preprotein translocase subunit SecG [Chitinophagaceae bacterium]